MARLDGKRIAFVVANSGVEQAELTQPWEGLGEEGAQTTLIAPETGKVQAFEQDVNEADTFEATVSAGDANADDYDALVLPGGTTNADHLRLDHDAVDLVRQFTAAGKPVAAICHGPWALVEAGVLSGKTLTSFPSLQTDIRNAGADWVNEESHTDRAHGWVLVTSRDPDDLDAFVSSAVEAFAE